MANGTSQAEVTTLNSKKKNQALVIVELHYSKGIMSQLGQLVSWLVSQF